METENRQHQNEKAGLNQKHYIKRQGSQPLLESARSREAPSILAGSSFSPRVAEHIAFLAATYPGTPSRFLLQLQQTHGNRYVQRVLQTVFGSTHTSEAGPLNKSVSVHTIQRGPTDPSPEVPALITSTVQQVNAALRQGTAEARQQAVNLIVDALIAAGSIEAQRLENGRVIYQPGFAPSGGGYGLTSLTPGTGLPRPCRVRIGDSAVTSASILYSTIMHEYQHVNQFWENTPGSEAIHEIQAYLYEIEHMRQSGLSNDLTQMSFLRRQLVAYWNRANPQNPALRQRYDRALQEIEDRIREIQTSG